MSLMMASSADDEFITKPTYSRWRVERGRPLFGEQLDEADDVGQRRAQFVGNVMHEIVAEVFRLDQRLVAIGERALDGDLRGNVDESDERRAVGQRQRGAIENGSVGDLSTRLSKPCAPRAGR